MKSAISPAVRREIERMLDVGADFHPYTAITIIAPDGANAGDTVNVIAQVTNITDINHIIWTQVYAPTGYLIINDYVSLIRPGETIELLGAFPMPNEDTQITAFTYYTDIYMNWYVDATETKDVTLTAEAPICQPGETMCGGPFDRDLYSCSSDGMRWELTERNSPVCYEVPPPPQCVTDADCPAGYVCRNNICVKEEKKEKFWMWAAIGVLAATAIGVVVLGGKKS